MSQTWQNAQLRGVLTVGSKPGGGTQPAVQPPPQAVKRG